MADVSGSLRCISVKSCNMKCAQHPVKLGTVLFCLGRGSQTKFNFKNRYAGYVEQVGGVGVNALCNTSLTFEKIDQDVGVEQVRR